MVWGIITDYRGNIWSAGSDGIFFNNPDKPGFVVGPAGRVKPARPVSSVTSATIACLSDACSICASSTWKSTINGDRDYYSIPRAKPGLQRQRLPG
ncbi:MAG: hypothetical protein MZV63_31260 [Marinilabiliales bacterium]|nr:hypothetical protein [Marinilabiliales bacterium]